MSQIDKKLAELQKLFRLPCSMGSQLSNGHRRQGDGPSPTALGFLEPKAGGSVLKALGLGNLSLV